MYAYVVTAQKPTAITKTVTGSFTRPDQLNLIVSKCTRLEIYLLTPEGLQPMYDVPIYGRVVILELFRPKGADQDYLFMCTERYDFCILRHDAARGEILTVSRGNAQDKNGRPVDGCPIGIIDPECRMIGLHLYEGTLKLIPFDTSADCGLLEAYNVRLEELQIIDLQFLHRAKSPTLAVLYQDRSGARHVRTYVVNNSGKTLVDGPWAAKHMERGASMIFAVPDEKGGLLIIGEDTITYHTGSAFSAAHVESTIFSCCERVDPSGSRYLLGDMRGRLYSLVLTDQDGQGAKSVRVDYLGQTTIASSISYLDNSVVYVGSSLADSQLITLENTPSASGSYVKLLETFPNLGPIVDFSVVDTEKAGQCQVVTCSGAEHEGSLRVVRNGIGINEQASIEMPGIKALWSLASPADPSHDQFIVLSFTGETRVLGITNDELGEVEGEGISADEETITCAHVNESSCVQVTRSGVRLLANGTFELVGQWVPGEGASITTAACGNGKVAVACGTNTLVVLDAAEGALKEVSRADLENEIACLSIAEFGAEVGAAAPQGVVAVGMWNSMTVKVLAASTLAPLSEATIPGDTMARSVLLVAMDGVAYLLCGLGDGGLCTVAFDSTTGELGEKKRLTLGTKPLVLTKFQAGASVSVFASCDRPTVIYSANKKLLFSNVNLKEVTHMCPFNSAGFPDSLALASENALTIGTVDDIQKLHIRKVPLNAQPRRIAHQSSTNAFAVATMQDANAKNQRAKFHVLFLHDQTFEPLGAYALPENEHCVSLASVKFGEGMEAFVCGTAFTEPNEVDPRRGRVIVLQLVDGEVHEVCVKEVNGAVWALSDFNENLVAGVNNRVYVFKLGTRTDGTHELVTNLWHAGHILALNVRTRGDFILVGDLMKSVSLYSYSAESGSIEEIARDYSTSWTTAMEILDDDTFVCAENSYNIFTVQRNSGAATDDERQRLSQIGYYHTGEFINSFRHGSLVMRSSDSMAGVTPRLIFGTVNGSIGVIAELSKERYDILTRVVSAMRKLIHGIGGFSHLEYRSFANERRTHPPEGYIDGDLVESFLDLRSSTQADVAREAGIEVDSLTRMIEELARTH